MAEAFSQEAVLDFLLFHGGKARNVDLTAHFRRFLRDPERQVQTRELFKKFVNSVAVVREEDGVKYIFLRKRFVELIPEELSISSDAVLGRPNKGEKARQRAGKCKQPAAGRQAPRAESKPAAEARRQEPGILKVSTTHRRPTGQEKAAPRDYSELSGDVVQAPKWSPKESPTLLQGENCAGEANRCPLLPERCRSELDPVRGNGKRANVDQPVRQRDCTGVTNKGEASVICKAPAQRSRNLKSKNRRPVATSLCTDDTVRLSNGDTNRSSNSSQSVLSLSTASPNLSHVAPPRSVAKCKGKGIPAHESPPNCNAEIISDESVTESIQYKPDKNPLENFVAESNKVFQRVQRQGITSPTHENKMTNHCKNPSSPKKHGSNDKVLKMLPGLRTGSDTAVPGSSAVCAEECIQKNQRKLFCRPSAGRGHLMGNSWHSEGQSISAKRHKPSLKEMVKSNGLLHKMSTVLVPLVSNQSTTPKIVDGDVSLHINDRPPCLAQTESHSECKKEDPLKIGDVSEKSSLVPLDSKEHEWIVKTAVGMFEQAYTLFREDPNFALKKDFISGYTVLHWIAKHGNHRALSGFIGGASKSKVELNIDIKSTCGYTPLHIAAIHGQLKIIQYLVKKYRANVNLRDHSGKKPWQYLNSEAPRDVYQMLGAPEHKHAMHSQNSSTFLAKDINREESSRAISRKTSFTALLKSPRILQKFTHSDSDRFHAVIEEDEQD